MLIKILLTFIALAVVTMLLVKEDVFSSMMKEEETKYLILGSLFLAVILSAITLLLTVIWTVGG